MSSMDADKTWYYQALLRHAIRALGFSKEERDLKIQMASRLNFVIKAIKSSTIPRTYDLFFSGSFVDGLDFISSDRDLIRRELGFKIESGFTVPRFGPQVEKHIRYNVVCGIQYEEEFPCYVKLPILKIHSYCTSEFTPIKCLKTYHLLNTVFKTRMLNIKKLSDTHASEIHKHKYVDNFEYNRNGPAIREKFYHTDSNLCFERDLVITLFFDDWPCIANDFLNRKRCNKWPSKRIIQSMQTKGCDLAPIGRADSREKDLLWRISFCGERDLFKSLNEIQIHCYLLMKIIVKDDMPINDEKDILSSFHLKNVIFWCIERSPKPWTRRHFYVAFKRCLYRLMDFLSNRYIPFFIIPSRNLFNSRLTEDIANKLIQVCRKYSDNPLNILLLKTFDELFMKTGLNMHLSDRTTNIDIAELKLQTQRSIINRCFSISIHTFVSIQGHEYWKYLPHWHYLNSGIDNWKHACNIMESDCKPYMEYELTYLKCMGALMLYARYKLTRDLMDICLAKFYIDKSLDLKVTSSTLRGASFYFMEKKYSRCKELCESIVNCPPHFNSGWWQNFDYDLANSYTTNIETETDLTKLKEQKNTLLPLFRTKKNPIAKTDCEIARVLNDFPYESFKQKHITVAYVTAEKWVLPAVLLYELLSRSKDSDNEYYKQFAGIFVDPMFNAWLLLYLCDLNMKDRSNSKYNKLRCMISGLEEDDLKPRYQYCNIIAYCLLKLDWKKEAVTYILESFCIYPSKYNAAFGYLKTIAHILLEII